MAINNFNKKKSNKNNIIKNLSLEKIIEKAGNSPEYREEFYKRFLSDDIYVLIDNQQGFNSFEETPIVVLPNNMVPVFTHPDRIYDNNAIPKDINYTKVNGSRFLKIAKEEQVIVNPFSKFYKELIPAEIGEMLSGSIFNTFQNNVRKDIQMEVSIGHPKIIPTEMLENLKILFNETAYIETAYIGWTYNPITDSKPHYIFAIESNSPKFETIVKKASIVAQKFLTGDDFVDFIKLEKGGNFSDFFYKKAEPFYKK